MPKVCRAGRFPLDVQGFSRTYRASTHALHLYEYAGRIRLDAVERPLEPGDLTISPANRPSSYDLDEPGHHLCIHFEPSRSRGKMVRLPLHIPLGPWRTYVAQQMLHIVELHARTGSRGEQGDLAAAAASAHLQALLMELALGDRAAEPSGKRRAADMAVQRVARFIHKRYDQPLSVEALADEADLSQGYLARAFRGRYGMTMQAFCRQRRMEVALHLLRSTDLPIKTIAHRVGVDDMPYFHKQFRAVTGRTPGSVKKEGQ